MSWQNWNFHIGFNGREGLTIHQVSYEDKGEKRPIIHRASVAEMVVNYSDFTEIRGWQNYFDAGEFQFGRFVNSLELGCDCLGERSEERRVGKECVSTCRSRWSAYPSKKTQYK